ncbi:hypothetical protein BgAZ_300050 [Babesia gibsoni]|uniref:RING-type domain-containing protein n=1 Tax=Babesia gibsoni TaxID=33632 RepID=A0AAD8PDL4_BABGI|nr:hypothetical protein BgAZ_300050 [Babesia gibsoni]
MMEKRKSPHPDDIDEAAPDNMQDEGSSSCGKRVCQTWVMRRIASEDKSIGIEQNTMEYPVEDASAETFNIRREDLDLLGGSFGSSELGLATTHEDTAIYTDHHPTMNNVITCDQVNGGSPEVCMESSGMQGDDVINFVNQAAVTDSSGHVCDLAPPGGSGDSAYQSFPRNDDVSALMEEIDYAPSGNYTSTNDFVYSSNPSASQLGANADANHVMEIVVNDEDGNESDCEIVGIVPNQHGVVMNNMVRPLRSAPSLVDFYDRLCDLAALSTGIVSNNDQQRPEAAEGTPTHVNDIGISPVSSDINMHNVPNVEGTSEYSMMNENHTMGSPTEQENGTQGHARVGAAEFHMNRRLDLPQITNDAEDDDVIIGPMFWGPPRVSFNPREYYARAKPIVSSYSFIEGDSRAPNLESILEDVEFLFRCPICYSTIARFKSGKVPNNNDRVIYSTKCGHMYCFECIESVKKRRECSICRKPIKDSKQYHVIYP